MKKLTSKLKGMDYKQLAIDHGEKFVAGLIGLLVLACLAMTPVARYDKAPSEFTDKVEEESQGLAASTWPEEKRQQFESAPDIAVALQQHLSPLDVVQFEYTTPMINPLYPKKEKIKEPEWLPAEELIADASVVVVAFPPEDSSTNSLDGQLAGDLPEDEANASPQTPGTNAPRGVNAPRRGGPNAPLGGAPGVLGAPGLPGGAPGGLPGGLPEEVAMDTSMMPGDPAMMGYDPAMMGYGMGGMMGGRQINGKGLRFVAIRGIFPMKEQIEKISKALNEPVFSKAAQYVNFLDFELQRQRAVKGPDPWSSEWETVDIQHAIDILEQVEFDAEVVSHEVIDQVFTMPLPLRVAGFWGSLGTHPKIKELTEAQIEAQRVLAEKAVEAAKKAGAINSRLEKGGFASAQFDIRSIRQNVFGSEMGEDIYASAQEEYMMQMQDMYGGAATPEMYESQMASVMGSYGAMMGGTRRSVTGMGGKALLFRYLDFDVEPGNAYRYRVRFRLVNPSYQRPIEELVDPEIAAKPDRTTPWSKPSEVAVVKDDSQFFLTKVNSGITRRGEATANVQVVQWYPDSGTWIEGEIRNVRLGQQVGGLETAKVLRPEQSLKEEEDVKFNAGDVLVDIVDFPGVKPDLYPNLNLDRRGIEFNNWVLTIDEFGQLNPVDSASQKSAMREAQGRVIAEREPWSFLEKQAVVASGMMPDGSGGIDAMMMDEAYMQMMSEMGGMMYPGAEQSNSRGRRGRRSALKR